MSDADDKSVIRLGGRSRVNLFVGTGLGLLAAGGLVTVIFLSANARALRQHTVHTTDARAAVLTLSAVGDLSALDEIERAHYQSSLNDLSKDSASLRDAVPQEQRPFLDAAITKLVLHGTTIEQGQSLPRAEHSMVDHLELQAILRDASIASAQAAASRERQAEIAAVVAAALLACFIGTLLSTRYRAQKDAATAGAYRDAANRFEALLDEAPDATAVVRPDGTLTYASARLAGLLGRIPATAADLCELATSVERPTLEAEIVGRHDTRTTTAVTSDLRDEVGNQRDFNVSITDLLHDPLVGGNLVTVAETTVETQTRRDLAFLATHDLLTSLPNRAQLMRDLDAPLAEALLLLNIDGFKTINDMHGHEVGDEILKLVARRLEGCLSPIDTMYRLGSDEFAFLTSRSLGGAERLAMTILRAFVQPVQIGTGQERVSVRIGAAHAQHGDSDLPLLRRADIALHEAKRLGGAQLVVSSDEIESRSLSRSHLSRAFATADLDLECHLAFQPIVDTRSGFPRYLEALARWTSPIYGPVGPDVFIPLAEASGRIDELGHWVLDHALQALADWRARGEAGDIGVTVNVSPHQLEHRGFVLRTKQLLDRHGIEPQALAIELTESVLATAIGPLVEQLKALRALGCTIACDDFGSGYSNLGQIMSTPLDMIKIDRALINKLTAPQSRNTSDAHRPDQVLRAVVSIADAMNATVVAEGVETSHQAETVAAAGVPLAQGHLFGKPFGAHEAAMYLRSMQSACS